MQHPDEGLIHTWLDGQLPPEESAALEAHAADCDECKAAIAEASGFIAASSRIISALDTVPGGVIPIAKPKKKVWYSTPQFRAAAAVLVVAAGSLLVLRNGNGRSELAVSNASLTRQDSPGQHPFAVLSAPPASEAAAVSASPPAANKSARKTRTSTAVASSAAQRVAPLAGAGSGVAVHKGIAQSEADFSGKGVKGGVANGVEGPVSASAESIRNAAPILEPRAADAFRPGMRALAAAEPVLKIVHVDSTASVKKTIYQTTSGSEVVLVEEELRESLADVTVTAQAQRQRAPTASKVSPPAIVSASPAPTAPSAPAIHTLSWIDPSSRHHFTLSGPVSPEELETLKTRLLQMKR